MWVLLLCLAIPLLAQEPDLRLAPVVSGLTAPTDIQHAGDGSGRIFVVEQAGVVRIVRNGALLPQPFLDIRGRVSSGGERGLLGLAFPPGYAGSQRFYVNYTDRGGDTVISMFRANGDTADPNSEVPLLNIAQPFANHNGGQIRFGPDGYLYIGMGDGGSGGDPRNYAQSMGSLLGKMLRIDVEREPGRYLVPPDNPFVSAPGARPEIWARGLRNPWRFSFDRATGDLYIADVGQNSWEEVNFTPASSRGGENYGWSLMEGQVCFRAGCSTQGLQIPVAVYPSNEPDCSVTGGFVYRGRQSPGLRGAYLFADFCSGRIRALRRQGGQWISSIVLAPGGNFTTFGEDEAGELYIANGNGQLLRFEGSRAPRLAPSGVGNAASFEPGIVAGSLTTLFAPGLRDDPGVVSAPGLPLPNALEGVSVTVNGAPVPIHSLANVNGVEQVTFQAPFDLTGSAATVAVSRDGFASASAQVPLLTAQPGVYNVVVHNADYTLVTPERPLARGEYAFVYAAGLGPVSSPPPAGAAAPASPLAELLERIELTIGGIPCEVQFAGLAPGFAGVYQVNFRVAADAPSGLQSLQITTGGSTSPPIQVPVL